MFRHRGLSLILPPDATDTPQPQKAGSDVAGQLTLRYAPANYGRHNPARPGDLLLDDENPRLSLPYEGQLKAAISPTCGFSLAQEHQHEQNDNNEGERRIHKSAPIVSPSEPAGRDSNDTARCQSTKDGCGANDFQPLSAFLLHAATVANPLVPNLDSIDCPLGKTPD